MLMVHSIRQAVHSQLESRAQKIERHRHRNSNIAVNLARAFAITIVVSHHLHGGGIIFPMTNWLVFPSFVIPLFTFISGYFFKKSQDDMRWLSFAAQKARALLVPYFVWNLIYGCLAMFLNSIDLVHYGDALSLETLLVRPWIDSRQFSFILPAWYLITLFVASILHFGLRRLLKKLHLLNEYVLLVITFLISAIAIYFAQKGYNTGLCLQLAKVGYVLPYLQAGLMFRNFEKLLYKHKALSLILLMGAIYLIEQLSPEPLYAGPIWASFIGNPACLILANLCSVLITMVVCELLAPAFARSRIVNAVGENSFSIMMHHPLIMFLINLALFGLSMVIDMNFNTARFKADICYTYPWRDDRIFLAYTAICIAVPVLVKVWTDNLTLRLHRRAKAREQS